MEIEIYDKFKKIIYDKAGINLGDKKQALVEARVSKRLRELQLPDLKAYLQFLKKDSSEAELVNLLDVISTNVTSFYRESVHFDFIGEQMKGWLRKGQRKFRFWSAACSSGEEPYTLAVTLLNCIENNNVDIRILATDISTQILQKAIDGVYPAEKTGAIPAEIIDKYFNRITINGEKYFQVQDKLKKLITFKRLNLSSPPFPMKGPMDCIFCRNVMIYFDNIVRKKLLSEVERLLKKGGYLFTGHAESLTGQLCALRSVKPSIYVK